MDTSNLDRTRYHASLWSRDDFPLIAESQVLQPESVAYSHHSWIDSGAHNLAMGRIERFPHTRHVLYRLDMVDSKIFQARNCYLFGNAFLLHHIVNNYYRPIGEDD